VCSTILDASALLESPRPDNPISKKHAETSHNCRG
jgi:hypothetical protein